jgi:hypothetical protein
MKDRVTGHHVRPQPGSIVREQRKRYGGMYAKPIYLREQAVNEELTTRVVPNEDMFMRPAAKSPSNVVMWLAGRDFALFCPRRGRIVCHQKRKDRRAGTPDSVGTTSAAFLSQQQKHGASENYANIPVSKVT